jgi:hypothetical protein
MVNKTFLPPLDHQSQPSNLLKNSHFLSWHGFRWENGEPAGLGQPSVRPEIGDAAWESSSRGSHEGENQRWRMRFSSD